MTTDADAGLDRASQLYDLGRPAEALEAVGGILATRPDDPVALRLAALCQSRLRRHDEALETAKAAVAADPTSDHGHRILAHIYYMVGQNALAADTARQAVKLAPQEWRAHMLLARCLCSDRPGEALAPAQTSTLLAPNSPETHFTLALAYQTLGRRQDARRTYLKVLEIDPQHAMAHNNVAVLDRTSLRWSRALKGFRRALGADPQHALARRNIEAIMRTWLGRLTLLAVLCVNTVNTGAPGLDDMGQRVLGLVIIALLAGSTVFTLWYFPRTVGAFAWSLLRRDRLAIVCAAFIAAAVLYVLAGPILRLFSVTPSYIDIEFAAAVPVLVVATIVRTLRRRRTSRSR